MTRLFKNVLVAALISLSTCSTACTKEVPVATPVPAPECSPGPMPTFPALKAEKCTDGEVDLVCLTPADAASIWAWARETGRWAERIQVCTDARALFPAGSSISDAIAVVVSKSRLLQFADSVRDPRVDFALKFEDCGTENAYYWYESHDIVVCNEILHRGTKVIRAIVAHEISHAYIMQLNVPFTGSHEVAADELGAYLLIKTGHAKDLFAIADVWKELDVANDVPGWDDHPDFDQRYWTLYCLGQEAIKVSLVHPLCRHDLARVTRTWDRLLK